MGQTRRIGKIIQLAGSILILIGVIWAIIGFYSKIYLYSKPHGIEYVLDALLFAISFVGSGLLILVVLRFVMPFEVIDLTREEYLILKKMIEEY